MGRGFLFEGAVVGEFFGEVGGEPGFGDGVVFEVGVEEGDGGFGDERVENGVGGWISAGAGEGMDGDGIAG